MRFPTVMVKVTKPAQISSCIVQQPSVKSALCPSNKGDRSRLARSLAVSIQVRLDRLLSRRWTINGSGGWRESADWYIWDSRYWISQQCAPELAPSSVADGKGAIRVPSASGELVATLAPPSPERNTVSLHPVQGGYMEDWS